MKLSVELKELARRMARMAEDAASAPSGMIVPRADFDQLYEAVLELSDEAEADELKGAKDAER